MTQAKVQCWTLVSYSNKPLDSIQAGNLLTGSATNTFSRDSAPWTYTPTKFIQNNDTSKHNLHHPLSC
jgi:hypothetical protein